MCRFYIPPQHGDSHFFSASAAECAAVRGKIGVDPNYSGYIEETPTAFYPALPDLTTGACRRRRPLLSIASGTSARTPITATRPTPASRRTCRRRTTSRKAMVPMPSRCARTQALLVDALVPTSGAVDVHARLRRGRQRRHRLRQRRSRAVDRGQPRQSEQLDRRVAAGPLVATAARAARAPRTRSTAAARGRAPARRCRGAPAARAPTAFERASDPWVTFAPDGTAYQAALGFNNVQNGDNAIIVSRSTDGGRTWSAATTLRRDTGAFQRQGIDHRRPDRRALRIRGLGPPRRQHGRRGSRAPSTAARPGKRRATSTIRARTARRSTTIVVVLPDGTLVLFFTELANGRGGAPPRCASCARPTRA